MKGRRHLQRFGLLTFHHMAWMGWEPVQWADHRRLLGDVRERVAGRRRRRRGGHSASVRSSEGSKAAQNYVGNLDLHLLDMRLCDIRKSGESLRSSSILPIPVFNAQSSKQQEGSGQKSETNKAWTERYLSAAIQEWWPITRMKGWLAGWCPSDE